MEEMLRKIIEMDEKARNIKEEAEQNKTVSEKEIESLKEQIHDDYINRANDRIEKNIAVVERKARERWEQYSARIVESKQKLQKEFDENKDIWTDEIVQRIIG